MIPSSIRRRVALHFVAVAYKDCALSVSSTSSSRLCLSHLLFWDREPVGLVGVGTIKDESNGGSDALILFLHP